MWNLHEEELKITNLNCKETLSHNTDWFVFILYIYGIFTDSNSSSKLISVNYEFTRM